ncbi:hypothetical protein JXA31_01860 [Candidatus Bathyarchaeota archaeon]|nr:hypothetical protein [Candidatus Bathyarchaeota archaeon]
MFNSRKVAVITLLGTLAFVSNGFLPSPIDKMLIGIQALCFSLAALLVSKGGAVYASFVTGVLLSVLRTGFFPFSLLFSLFYGLLIEGLFYFFKVRKAECVKSRRLILLLTVATGITGVVSMYLTTMLCILPMIPAMYFAIIVVAVLNGVVAGYLTVMIWNKYLSQFFS